MVENLLKSRSDAAMVLLDMIRPLKQFYSKHHAWLHVGNTGAHYGEKAALMEGFARVLWGVGPLVAGDNRELSGELQQEIEGWHQLYLDGIIHGTDPAHEEYWGSIKDYDQKMVEMAALTVAVSLSPEKWWEPLTKEQRHNFYAWLNQINEKEVHPNNWRFFRILVNMTFRVLGLAWNAERMRDDLSIIEGCYTGDGWYYDGNAGQVDYYIPFAMEYYGLIYAEFMKKEEPEYSAMLRQRAEQFCGDFVYWFAADGSEIPYGRSLTYRFAHGAFFSAMAFAGVEGVGYGVMKGLALGNLREWLKRPIFDASGVLTIGYGYPNLIMSERYNSPGSPYWSFKLFLMLALPGEHPFWTAQEEAFPYEEKKRLDRPHMLMVHEENGHVMAFTAGQHCRNHGNCAAKYEKFVYSNKFGFSVSRGFSLEDGAFDSTLAVSAAGGEDYRVRYGKGSSPFGGREDGEEAFLVTEDSVTVVYQISPEVQITSKVIPLNSWHVRIHWIKTEKAIDVADGGFAIPSDGWKEHMVLQRGAGIIAAFPRVAAGAYTYTGGDTRLVSAYPNTNLMYNLTVIPTVERRLEAGEHLLIHCFAAELGDCADRLVSDAPQISIASGKIIIAYDGKQLSVEV